jgi:pimeloyl-ACP methyl ester carboxylesterase
MALARSITVTDPEFGRFDFDAIADGPVGGDLVLLAHGFPETKRSFRAQLPALAAAGYRAVAVDQRGYSPGARPEGIDAYRVDRLAGDLLAIADQLGAERFHLVGHDYGAVVAWQVAARHGDRLATMTSLSVPHPVAYLEAYETADQASRSSYFEWFCAEGSEDDFVADDCAKLRWLYTAAGLSAEDVEAYTAALGTREAIGSALNWYRAAGPYMIDGLGPVTVPVLFIWSTADPALGPEGAYGTARHVGGPYRFEVLEGVDHWIPEHAPEAVNRLLIEHISAHPA